MLGDDGDEGPPKSGSDCDSSSFSSLLDIISSQSGGGGAVAVNAIDDVSFGNGFNGDVNIGAHPVDGGLHGELGGVGFLGGADELDVATSGSRGRFFGAAFGGMAFDDEAGSDIG